MVKKVLGSLLAKYRPWRAVASACPIVCVFIFGGTGGAVGGPWGRGVGPPAGSPPAAAVGPEDRPWGPWGRAYGPIGPMAPIYSFHLYMYLYIYIFWYFLYFSYIRIYTHIQCTSTFVLQHVWANMWWRDLWTTDRKQKVFVGQRWSCWLSFLECPTVH